MSSSCLRTRLSTLAAVSCALALAVAGLGRASAEEIDEVADSDRPAQTDVRFVERAATDAAPALAPDRLTVSLLAGNDAPAALLIVRDAEGWIRYVDAVPLSALDWDEPVATWTPALALERLRVTTPRLSEYAPHLVPRADAGVGAFWPLIDASTLDRLTDADAPLLCYVQAPGGYLCAAYDPDIARGLAVIEGAS